MWILRNLTEDHGGGEGKKKRGREPNHKRLLITENKLRVDGGVGGVIGIEEGTFWDEHWVLYGKQFDNKFHIKKKNKKTKPTALQCLQSPSGKKPWSLQGPTGLVPHHLPTLPPTSLPLTSTPHSPAAMMSCERTSGPLYLLLPLPGTWHGSRPNFRSLLKSHFIRKASLATQY